MITTNDYGSYFVVSPRTLRNALPDGFAARTIPFPHETLMYPPTIDMLASTLDDLVEAGGTQT
jgi:hypothetical protein